VEELRKRQLTKLLQQWELTNSSVGLKLASSRMSAMLQQGTRQHSTGLSQ
jgi:hypothetical protein